MVDIRCATEFLLQARDAKVNNIEDGTEGQAEFIGSQKRYQTGESRWLPGGHAAEMDLDGMSACRKGGEKVGMA